MKLQKSNIFELHFLFNVQVNSNYNNKGDDKK